uniref:Biogenesis of lysosome-related organelles complex 1 subunit 4 n=1 Tax=Graphocephala atropunctata TaxID=36148 RepID=A0A1B6LIP9_9HEMI
MNNEETAKKLADSYAAYVKVDNEKEMRSLYESIEDTLTRLEELESGIKMLQVEREKFSSCDFTAARFNLNALCQRIHKLDEMSKTVLKDVEALEPLVDEAEASLVNSTEGKLKSLLKPLFHMRLDTMPPATSGQTTAQYTPPNSFKTSEFFPKSVDEEVLSTSASSLSEHSVL